jgi:hypothetical protein
MCTYIGPVTLKLLYEERIRVRREPLPMGKLIARHKRHGKAGHDSSLLNGILGGLQSATRAVANLIL